MRWDLSVDIDIAKTIVALLIFFADIRIIFLRMKFPQNSASQTFSCYTSGLRPQSVTDNFSSSA